jgi:hypothetical protein
LGSVLLLSFAAGFFEMAAFITLLTSFLAGMADVIGAV